MGISQEYKNALDLLDNTLNECIRTSQQYADIKSKEARHYYASVLFTRMCTMGVSFIRFVPGNRYVASTFDHWDYATAASLTRNQTDCLNTMLYLTEDGLSPEEWDCRWNLFNLHDAVCRKKIFEFRGETLQVTKFESDAEVVRNRLKINPFFNNFTEKQQKHYLKGTAPFILEKEEIVTRNGGDKDDYLGLYKFLSVHTHSFPMSFYSMDESERGRGLHSDVEEEYTCMCINIMNSSLNAGLIKFRHLFKNETSKA